MVDSPLTPNPTPNTENANNKSVLDLSNFSLTPASISGTTTIAKPETKQIVQQTPTIPPIALNLDSINKIPTVTPKVETKTATLPNIPNKAEGNNVLNLGSLTISQKVENKTDKQKTNELLASGIRNEIKKEEKKAFVSNIQIIVTSYIIIFCSILGIIGLQSYKQFIDLQSQAIVEESKKSFLEKGEKVTLFLSKTLKIDDYADRIDKSSLLTSNEEKDVIVANIKNNPRLNYTQKRTIIQKNIDELNNTLIADNNHLESTKAEIEKYGFIPKELYDMTQKGEGIDNIRRSMVLTENIKFVTAFKVFGYMQSFIQGFASDSGIDPIEAETQINELNENGEKDIITYTNNCYFNPYEIGDDCSITNEFDNYYTLIDKKSKINKNFIKKIASYTQRKLQEKDIPNYTITFPEFDPKNQDISFTTEINTNRPDELALNKIGVINPHLHIITNLINTLKQSLLVIGENIKIDQIKILPKTIRVGSTIFNVNTSTLNFKLPIQKTDQREITDFFSSQSLK